MANELGNAIIQTFKSSKTRILKGNDNINRIIQYYYSYFKQFREIK